MTIKAKMTLWYTVLMVVLAALILFFMLYISSAVAENSAERILKNMVGKNQEEVWYRFGRLTTFSFDHYDDGAYSQVYDKQGELREGLDPWQLDVTPYLSDGSFRTIDTGEDKIYFYSMRVWADDWSRWSAGGFGGQGASGEPGVSGESEASGEPDYVWVTAMLPAENLTVVSRSVIRVAFIALPILMLLAIAGSWLIAHRSLAPVRKITESAHEISTGDDLSRRIELGPGRDEIHTLADTFNDMFARLERAFLAERQFTSDASHELRTPTAVILAECGMAKKLPDEPAELRQSLKVVERQARKMSALVSRLLTFTRLEQGTQKIKTEEIDLSELTRAVCEEQKCIESDKSIQEDVAPEVFVRGDGELLAVLLQNLISNARKYGRENGSIWISLRKDGGTALLSVKDDGVGISAEQLPRIWDRFYQADPSRTNRDGSLGLGLAMVKEIARLHGGDVSAESEPGQGSVFTFAIPCE